MSPSSSFRCVIVAVLVVVLCRAHCTVGAKVYDPSSPHPPSIANSFQGPFHHTYTHHRNPSESFTHEGVMLYDGIHNRSAIVRTRMSSVYQIRRTAYKVGLRQECEEIPVDWSMFPTHIPPDAMHSALLRFGSHNCAKFTREEFLENNEVETSEFTVCSPIGKENKALCKGCGLLLKTVTERVDDEGPVWTEVLHHRHMLPKLFEREARQFRVPPSCRGGKVGNPHPHMFASGEHDEDL